MLLLGNKSALKGFPNENTDPGKGRMSTKKSVYEKINLFVD